MHRPSREPKQAIHTTTSQLRLPGALVRCSAAFQSSARVSERHCGCAGVPGGENRGSDGEPDRHSALVQWTLGDVPWCGAARTYRGECADVACLWSSRAGYVRVSQSGRALLWLLVWSVLWFWSGGGAGRFRCSSSGGGAHRSYRGGQADVASAPSGGAGACGCVRVRAGARV